LFDWRLGQHIKIGAANYLAQVLPAHGSPSRWRKIEMPNQIFGMDMEIWRPTK
jgi:hypothetical protein